MKIEETVQVLTNFSAESRAKSRQEYLEDLASLVSKYYDYNTELANYLVAFFPPTELVDFLEANQVPRPLVIRANTLRTKRRELAQVLIQKGVNLDPVGEWNKVGLKIIESQVPIGATTEYLAGQYMLQSASSFLPVMALAPKPGERVLDMCASPGGKTTHLGQLMKNSGILMANEFNKERIPALSANLQRMGITNSIVTNYDGRKMNKLFNCFDRVLVDAPCSGLGVIWKDQSIKAQRTLKEIKANAHIQKELLLAAIDCVNARSSTGGFVVYSTCSIAVEENEEVIHHALKNRNVKIVETGLSIGEAGLPKYRGKHFHYHMTRAKRIYPHIYNMEGFFVCKLKKLDNTLPEGASKPHSAHKRPKQKKAKNVEFEVVKSDEARAEELVSEVVSEPQEVEEESKKHKKTEEKPKETEEEPKKKSKKHKETEEEPKKKSKKHKETEEELPKKRKKSSKSEKTKKKHKSK